LHSLASDWVGAMPLQPWNDIGKVKYGSISGADRMFEWLKAKCAVVEGQSFESCSTSLLLSARGRRKGRAIGAGPFAVGDLASRQVSICTVSVEGETYV